MTRTLIGTAVGALALGSLVTVQALKAPSTDASRMARTFESRADASTGPVLVNCGEGFRALVRPVGVAGQQGSQVDCVAAAPTLPVTVDAWGQPVAYATQGGPMLASYTTAASRPIARTATQTVYRERPATYRTSTVTRRQPTTQVRSWKKSALIIGGSAAGGAAVGAVLDGKSGAKKGAVVGGVAGTVYDIATRSKTRY